MHRRGSHFAVSGRALAGEHLQVCLRANLKFENGLSFGRTEGSTIHASTRDVCVHCERARAFSPGHPGEGAADRRCLSASAAAPYYYYLHRRDILCKRKQAAAAPAPDIRAKVLADCSGGSCRRGVCLPVVAVPLAERNLRLLLLLHAQSSFIHPPPPTPSLAPHCTPGIVRIPSTLV